VGIEPEDLMAEESANVKKISGATPNIQNLQRWGPIQPKILGSFHIDADPVLSVLKPIDPWRMRPRGMAFSLSGKFCAINRGKNGTSINWMYSAAGVFPEALQNFTRKQFPKLTRESHGRNDAWNPVTNKPALAAASQDPSE